jgi:two-component system response regulator HydG
MSSCRKKERILVVDDSSNALEVLRRNLTTAGYQVFTAPSVPGAIEILDQTRLDLVITDLTMPKVSGLDLVRHIGENFKDTEVMMITGYPSVEGAVEAVKTGAEEFLAKPLTDAELLSAVQRVRDKARVCRFGRAKTDQAIPVDKGLVGTSEEMRGVRSL